MATPLISVIMPAFNRQETIAYAIESVLNQTYGRFELILVDDASTDATAQIMALYATKDARVHVEHNRNNSRASAIEWEPRNDGLKVAQGRLIAYLDSDNLWHPDYLRTCSMPLRRDRGVQLVHCNSRNHYRDRRQYLRVLRNDRRRLVEANAADLTAVYSYDLYDGVGGLSWYIDTNEMMHRASVFRELHYLWATRHPNRASINASQLVRCRYRRHNDQELAQRIIAHYGIQAVRKHEAALVDFFYAPRQARFLSLRFDTEVRRLRARHDPGHARLAGEPSAL